MDFTFGIITNGSNIHNNKIIISSIQKLNIPNYEIIVIGGSNEYDNSIIHIQFDEKVKKGWITKKKNIVCQKAKYENIVLVHDYINFEEDWYEGFLKFGNSFDVCVTKIKKMDGTRFRDYVIFPYGHMNPFHSRALIPYDYPPSLKLSKIMYISGAYYVIKKKIALQYPLDERLLWGQGEDVLLSKILTKNNIIIQFNSNSSVRFLKNKDSMPWETPLIKEDLLLFEMMTDLHIETINKHQINQVKGHIMHQTSISISLD
jgi:hypothetical protein